MATNKKIEDTPALKKFYRLHGPYKSLLRRMLKIEAEWEKLMDQMSGDELGQTDDAWNEINEIKQASTTPVFQVIEGGKSKHV